MRRIIGRSCWRRVCLCLLVYLLLIFILSTLGPALGFQSADELVLWLTPRCIHYPIIMLFFFHLNIRPDSSLFASVRFSIPPHMVQAELAWRRRQTSCNNFSGAAPPLPALGKPELALQRPPSSLLTPSAAELGAEATVLEDLQRWGHAPSSGGWYRPKGCSPKEVVAIVIPYRNRHENLVNFLSYIHAFLQRQRRHYVVVVVEQVNQRVRFNRAKLFNAAVKEMEREMAEVECIVFHDVDKLPLHLFNLYACGEQPRQLFGSLWTLEGSLVSRFYDGFLGGVTAFTKWQWARINGASNVFYGWGGEDDDVQIRTRLGGYVATNSEPDSVARYVDVQHSADTVFETSRFEKLVLSRVVNRMKKDGLKEVEYRVVGVKKRTLYTVFSIDVLADKHAGEI